jgi:uncharacterized protein YydD (DUF2326 family)
MQAAFHESLFLVRKINASMHARITLAGTHLCAIVFALTIACIRQFRLPSKRSLMHDSIHTSLDTRLHAHMRTDM